MYGCNFLLIKLAICVRRYQWTLQFMLLWTGVRGFLPRFFPIVLHFFSKFFFRFTVWSCFLQKRISYGCFWGDAHFNYVSTNRRIQLLFLTINMGHGVRKKLRNELMSTIAFFGVFGFVDVE